VTPIPGSAEHLPRASAKLLLGGPAQALSAKVATTASAILQTVEVDVPVDVAVEVAVAVDEPVLDVVELAVADEVAELVLVAL
jgi:hypothetical protein